MKLSHLFRWRKPFVTNKEELVVLSEDEKKLVEKHRKELDTIERGQRMVQTELAALFEPQINKDNDKIHYLYDFSGGWHSGGNQIVPISVGDVTVDVGPVLVNAGTPQEQVVGHIIGVKPKDVLHELAKSPTADMIENIDAKITVLKDKKELIVGGTYAQKELIGMVERLENRKKWDEFKEFYSQFDNTTSDKIQDLVNKYKLVVKGSDLFIAAFPDEAVAIMKEYRDQTVKLCGKQPFFYVIAEEKQFKDEYKKKDPILLAQSPFGAYWQILGAWDREMILLEDL